MYADKPYPMIPSLVYVSEVLQIILLLSFMGTFPKALAS